MKLEVVELKHEHSLDPAAGDADMDLDNRDADSFSMLPVACKEEHLSDDCNVETNQMSPALFIKPECKEEAVDEVAPIKDEITFGCTTCLKEFEDEDTYTHHVVMHMKDDQDSDEAPVADYPHNAVATSPANILTNQKIELHQSAKFDKIKKNVLLNAIDADDDVEYILVTENSKTIIKSLKKSKIPNNKYIESNLARYVKISNKNNKESILCDVCNFKFTEKSSLVLHLRTHTGEKPCACELCSYKCSRSDTLVSHMRTHTDGKPFACKLCSYKCSRGGTLVSHMKIHTGEKPFSCNLCSYKCIRGSALVHHMRTHTGDKPFACEFCNFKCTRKSGLTRHMRTHTGVKPFACMLCSYKSTVSSSLVLHMRTHTGEKPFACNLCSYKCSQSSTLVQHMRTHTGEKPFSCNLCSYKCIRGSALVHHMRTHTGDKPFACMLCSYKCTQNRTLVLHMRTHTTYKNSL